MISMLDTKGDGQIGYPQFKAMVESEDPANENFLENEDFNCIKDSVVTQRRAEELEKTSKKREVLSRIAGTCNLVKGDVTRMWDVLRQRAFSSSSKVTHDSFKLGYNEFTEIMPAFDNTSEARCIFDLFRNGKHLDGREVVMSFSSFVDSRNEERCRLAFDMYDEDRSGYLSMDEVEALMMSTHLTTRDIIKKKAQVFMRCADEDGSKNITIDELIVASERLPNLIFPKQ